QNGSQPERASWPSQPASEAPRAFAVATPSLTDQAPRAGIGAAASMYSTLDGNGMNPGVNPGAIGRLIVRPLAGEAGGQTPEIGRDGRDVAIGRSPACDVVLEGDQLVSRRHALLRYNGSQYTVVDLGSSNGTYLNDNEIHSTTVLNDNDLITIGEHEL